MSGTQPTSSVTLTLAEWQLVYTGLSELTKAAAAVAGKVQGQLATAPPAPARAAANGELREPANG